MYTYNYFDKKITLVLLSFYFVILFYVDFLLCLCYYLTSWWKLNMRLGDSIFIQKG